MKFFARLLFAFVALFALAGSFSPAAAQYYHRRYHRPYRPYHRRYYHRPYHRPYRRY